MDRKKLITILGARPQFVKAAALSRELNKYQDIEEIIVHTGQHFDQNMSDVFFEEMQIPRAKYQLSISGLSHGAMTGKMMEEIEQICLEVGPDAIMVYGDTNSTLAGALVGSKLHIPVIHVEAGLRSFNMQMPEEVNRILTDRVSSLLLCPTETAVRNLSNEGYENFPIQIERTGDVMEDVANFYGANLEFEGELVERLGLKPDGFVLLTCHRAENTNNSKRMSEIIEGIKQVSQELPIVWPVHPRMKSAMSQYDLPENVFTLDPLGYFDMIRMIKNCALVLTDSGGLQKEAYFFNKYCITMRDQTEWVELVDEGLNYLSKADANEMKRLFFYLIEKKYHKKKELYGGGKASKYCADVIYRFLSNRGPVGMCSSY